MMKLKFKHNIILLLIIFSGFTSISNPTDLDSVVSNEIAFSKFKMDFMDKYWELHPEVAIYSGNLNDAAKLVVYDKKYFDYKNQELIKLQKAVSKFNPESLPDTIRIELFMIRDQIASDLWYLNEFREYEWNPAYYNIGGAFAEILGSSQITLEEKLTLCGNRLLTTREFYTTAIQNLKAPVKEHTELAITQNQGALPVFENMLTDSLKICLLPEKDKIQIKQHILFTVDAIKEYMLYLNGVADKLKDENSERFRLGSDLYAKKFQHDIQSAYSADEVYQMAIKRKYEVEEKMAVLAKEIWSKYKHNTPLPEDDRMIIREVINEISKDHVHRDSFKFAIEEQIHELADFVNQKKLLYLDPSKPLVVRQTPGYMEGSGAGVTISAPGPFDKDGNTYYNVSPLSGYSSESAESYLREYNNYTLQILNIHEAIPGHYTQLVYSNRSPSLVKSVLGNGAMIEGWAVYAERMMLESGYGNHSPEMWLMYYKWHLRSVCNTILDISVHTKNMKESDAIRFLTQEAFQELAEAQGKWRRVKLSQVQLCSYFTGYTEIYNLREEIKSSRGTLFDLKSFHETFLSFGSAPVKYIRAIMTGK